jgi:DnaJ-class molecular chaperone
MSDDLYATLAVKRDASQDEIKRAYRRLAKEMHPDLNPDKPEVGERFKAVTAAYDILSDPERRGRYDRGEIDAEGHERPQYRTYRDFAEDPGATRFYTREGFSDEESLHDFFEGLFGGAAAGRREFRPQARGADVSYTLPVEFLDAAKGATRRVQMADGRTLDIKIPPGISDRQTLRLKGQGMPGFKGGPPGDAFVELHIQPHRFFERKDGNVHFELPVTLAEAVLGGKVEVPTIDGPVTMTVPSGSNTGSTLRLRGRGIVDPASGRRGDQYVRLKVMLPKEPDGELEEFLRRWSKEHPYEPRRELETEG